MRISNRLAIAALALVLPMLAACGEDSSPAARDDGTTTSAEDGELVVYSGRNENLVRPLIDRFESESGIDVEVRYADTTELTATLLEEGGNSPADVFFSQDAGALAALEAAGRLGRLPDGVADDVDTRFRDPEGTWTGVTGRARTIVYNPDKLAETEVPDDILEVAEPKWRGRVGLAPTNSSFVSHVSALVADLGEADVRKFLSDLDAIEPKAYDSNSLVVKAVAAGEIDLGLVNHYYALNEKKENPDSSVANVFPAEGAFVNLAGVGIIEGARNRAQAEAFVEFLLSEEGQEYFRTETNEYPLVDGIRGPEGQPALEKLNTIEVPLDELGKDLEKSASLIKEAGLS